MAFKIFLLIFFPIACFAQTSPLKMATLSSGMGSSSYPQSIGQSAVLIGTGSAGAYVIRQGFLQPSSRSMRRSIEPVSLITFEAFPNPFSSHLRLQFSTASAHSASVELYSIDGLRVWSGEIAANLSEVQLVDFDRFPIGKYILKLIYPNQVITKSIIKL
jgi:hypothetical protein